MYGLTISVADHSVSAGSLCWRYHKLVVLYGLFFECSLSGPATASTMVSSPSDDVPLQKFVCHSISPAVGSSETGPPFIVIGDEILMPPFLEMKHSNQVAPNLIEHNMKKGAGSRGFLVPMAAAP